MNDDEKTEGEGARDFIRETIRAVDSLETDGATRDKIFGGNLERLLRLN